MYDDNNEGQGRSSPEHQLGVILQVLESKITPSFSSIPNLCCTATLFLSPSRSLKFSLTSSETKRDLGFKQSLPAVQSVNQLD
ncbi:hypothetical protein L2E82_31430 [Cichorium intybus]|uniref:Uncharacterized protein n=1 Tax=Cichorium intybus TaxID=13427 RepID=A0ACB9D351_CICIN|nr:hypothetical protein L2E82_31430 [Cichorium intybus]